MPQSTPNQNKKRKNKNKEGSGQNDSGTKSHEEQSSSKPIRSKKKYRPGPRVSKVLTGYQGVDKNKIKDIIVYDIPSTWTEEQLLLQLKAWGNVIQFSTKVQRKYQTLRVKVELAENPLQAFLRHDWMVSLGGIPVRWYPGNFTLKERKQRERFVSVINDIPESMTTEALYHFAPHQFLTIAEVKGFKVIKTSNGSRKLLGYYETFDKMKEHQSLPQGWGDNLLTWTVPEPIKKKNFTQQKRGGNSTTKTKDSSQNQQSNKKNNTNKKGNKKKQKSSVKKGDLRKLFAEFLRSVF